MSTHCKHAPAHPACPPATLATRACPLQPAHARKRACTGTRTRTHKHAHTHVHAHACMCVHTVKHTRLTQPDFQWLTIGMHRANCAYPLDSCRSLLAMRPGIIGMLVCKHATRKGQLAKLALFTLFQHVQVRGSVSWRLHDEGACNIQAVNAKIGGREKCTPQKHEAPWIGSKFTA